MVASTKRRMALYGEDLDQALSVGLISTLGLDGGNAHLKVGFPGGEVWSIPSCIYELDEYDEVATPTSDEQSVLVELDQARYLIGEAAEYMGGQPIYRLRKEDVTHILFAAALSQTESSVPTVETVNVLVPDGRKAHIESSWAAAGDRIKTMRECIVNGIRKTPQVRNVNFVHEGVPAFAFAKQYGLLDRFDGYRAVGTFDVGGGEATLQRHNIQSGQIDWNANLTLPGVCSLAAAISAMLKNHFPFTPDDAVILRALSQGRYLYRSGGKEIDFEQIYEKAVGRWQQDIARKIYASKIMGSEFGGAVIVGGGAVHCAKLVEATQERFFIPETDVPLQHINAVMLAKG